MVRNNKSLLVVDGDHAICSLPDSSVRAIWSMGQRTG